MAEKTVLFMARTTRLHDFIRTLSITFPSSNANRYFLVPSIFEICTASCFKLTK